MAKHISWDALQGAGIEPQTLDWEGGNLNMTSNGNTITIAAANLLNLMQFVLDTAVVNEGRSPNGGDKYARARNALGASAGVSLSGFTAAQTTSRGTVLTQTSGGETFDVAEPHRFCVAIANLCQSSLKTEAGLLARM